MVNSSFFSSALLHYCIIADGACFHGAVQGVLLMQTGGEAIRLHDVRINEVHHCYDCLLFVLISHAWVWLSYVVC